MFRLAEVAIFSIFFVFSFIKLFSSSLIEINTLTYFYYLTIMLFLGRYFLLHQVIQINFLLVSFLLSIGWLTLIGLTGAQSETLVFDKLKSLFISLLSIPVAIYMYQRNLLKSTVIFTTIFLMILSILFSMFITYDEEDPAFILNEIYLHGSFIAGFMIFLSFLLRLNIIWPIILITCLIILGGRGPLLSLIIASMFIVINFTLKLIKVPKLNKRGAAIALSLLPIIFTGILKFFPNLFDRMIARLSYLSSGGDSTLRRIEHINTSLAAFDSSPIIGIGISNYGLFLTGSHNDSYPHNFILEILAENGLLGGLPVLACIVLIFIKSIGNKSWPLLLYVLFCLLISYSYATSNELYFALTLALIFIGINNAKNENIRNHSKPSF
jgi:O-antigen ligase